MRIVAAYLLAAIGGNQSPSQDDVKNILSSVGVAVDEEKLAKLFSELEGKDLDELIAAGTEKLSAVPSGGGGGGGGAAAAPAAGGEAAAAPEPEPEEEEEEEEEDMGFSLFD